MQDTYEHIIDQILEQGYGVVDQFLPPDLVLALQASFAQRQANHQFRKAGISKDQAVVDSIRGDEIFWLEDEGALPAERQYLDLVTDFSAYLNRTCYLGIRSHEFHYASYPVGTFYKRHLDQFKSDSARKLSMICYLNPDWEPSHGGALRLYLPTGPLDILPEGGRVAIFQSHTIEHEVLPATRERRSVTGWLRG